MQHSVMTNTARVAFKDIYRFYVYRLVGFVVKVSAYNGENRVCD